MSRVAVAPEARSDVRAQAASRLTGGPDGQRATHCSPDALAVLYQLASSPATAHDALALLHELQVHQVELDLQAEELRDSRAELEAALRRRIELQDALPVGCFTVDRGGVLQELNLTGAAMLGIDRDKGPGQLLEDYVAAGSCGTVRRLMASLDDNQPVASSTLELRSLTDDARPVGVHVSRDPRGSSFLVVLSPTAPAIQRTR